jgi:membrane protein YqaA with SNARE-associated domain
MRKQRAIGPTRARLRALGAKLLDLVGQERWGLPIVFIAVVVGFPPLYAVALLAGATTMRPGWFGLTVFVGRLGRFLLVATGFHGLRQWFI